MNLAPKRIISLVPSISELLVDLGLYDSIVGVTSFCVKPPELLKLKTIVGGISGLKFERIEDLKPDLIIASKEENNKEEIEYLESEYRVELFDVNSFSDALEMIISLGEITGRLQIAHQLVREISTEFSTFPLLKAKKTAICIIWKKPYISLSGNTYINSLLELIGLNNCIVDNHKRYPEISLDSIIEKAPDYLFLLSEPCYFGEEDKEYFSQLLPYTDVKLVDGEMFAWYGSRMLKAGEYLKSIF